MIRRGRGGRPRSWMRRAAAPPATSRARRSTSSAAGRVARSAARRGRRGWRGRVQGRRRARGRYGVPGVSTPGTDFRPFGSAFRPVGDGVRTLRWDSLDGLRMTPPPVHLEALEAESIHIIREVAAEFERPVLLFSGGKDSMVHAAPGREGVLARPAPVPGDARRHRPQLPRGDRVPRPARRASSACAWWWPRCRTSIDAGRVVEETGPRASRNRLQTTTLLDAIEEHRFDAVFGGARRDEEKARAKERVFSLPRRVRPVGPEEPAPRAVEPLQRPAPARASTSGSSRSRNWTELDIWQYIARRGHRAAVDLLRPPPRGVPSATACCWRSTPVRHR